MAVSAACALSTLSYVEPSFAQGKPPPAAAVQVATAQFKEGQALFQKKNFAAALEKFNLSYQTVPSPNSGLYIARCHAEMGHNKEAYLQYKRVVAEAEARVPTEPKYAPTLETAKTELQTTAGKLAIVTVQVNNAAPNATLRIGTTTIPQDQWGQPVPLDPGSIDVVLDTVGSAPVTQRVDLRAGEQKTVSIGPAATTGPLPPPPPPRKESETELELLPVSLAFAGVGVVGMGMFAVAGGMSLGTFSEAEDNCPNGAGCTNDLIDRGEREQLIANIGVIIGGVGLAVGTTVFIIDVANGGGSSDEAKNPVNLAIGPGYVGVNGAF
ncbi:MAG: tetratricopeptide repeat protein [Polyangiaceae bacterium]|nr:tetratricopeptide repeat protein [Polyangiaceae bacterium]